MSFGVFNMYLFLRWMCGGWEALGQAGHGYVCLCGHDGVCVCGSLYTTNWGNIFSVL